MVIVIEFSLTNKTKLQRMYFGILIQSHKLRRVFLAEIGDGHNGNVNKDLPKVQSYSNQLLNMYKTTGAGFKIGNISINSTACADDIVLFSQGPCQAQIIIDVAYDYAYMEGQ